MNVKIKTKTGWSKLSIIKQKWSFFFKNYESKFWRKNYVRVNKIERFVAVGPVNLHIFLYFSAKNYLLSFYKNHSKIQFN
jgi:hypothetical protein